MKKSSSGYTFLEVMLVLAISTFIFISSFIVFLGQQRETSFSQSMEDLSSKVQTIATRVSANNYGDIENYTCATSGSPPRAELTAGSGQIASNQDCIILGQAVHTTPGNSNIYIYTVLGSREQANGDIASSVEQANPNPAMVGAEWVLVEEYELNNGMTVKSSTIPTSGGTSYNLVGIYNSLQNDAGPTGGAASSLMMKAYPSPGAPKSSTTQACIQEDPAVCVPINTKVWELCLSNAEESRSSQLVVTAQPTGITTKINDRVCS